MTCERETVRLFKPQFGPILLSVAMVLLLGGVSSTRAQLWTTSSNASNNINNTNSGSVGIGTDAPTTKLTVTDGAAPYAAGATDLFQLKRNASNGTSDANGVSILLGNNSNAFRIKYGGTSDRLSFLDGGNVETLSLLNGGKVGVGTTTPASKLEVLGGQSSGLNDTAWFTGGAASYNTGPRIVFGQSFGGNYTNWRGAEIAALYVSNGTTYSNDLVFTTNAGSSVSDLSERMRITYAGNVGIGTTSPYTKLQVAGGDISIDADHAIRKAGDNSIIAYSSTLPGIAIGSGTATDQVIINSGGSERLRVLTNGNVGIGKPNPEVALDVIGDIQASGVIHAKYQDVAEWVPSSEQLSAGTVVVLDSTKSNQVTSSSVSYDTRVAGVVSEQPGIALGEKSEGKVLVATTGRVRVKVDASKGPIHIGDLLVTSDVPGLAMKSEPIMIAGRQIHGPGTIIGKALEPLAKGKGEILVLLSLQ